MKKNKLNILFAWLLLICFVAGQGMVYMHQHILAKGLSQKEIAANNAHPQQTLKEKCDMCDAMHHTNALATDNTIHFNLQLISQHVYKPCVYDFVSIALVLAAGRAPPVVS